MKKEIIKKIGGMVLDVLIVLVIIFAIIISIITLTSNEDGIPDIFGYSPFNIQSNSMYPVLKKGDLIIVKKYNSETLKKGDIISFISHENSAKIIKTHRIVDVMTDAGVFMYTTQGDNNEIEDNVLVTENDIVGVYTNKKIPYIGTIIDFLKSKVGFFIFILMPLSIIFIYQIVDFFKLLLKYKLEDN